MASWGGVKVKIVYDRFPELMKTVPVRAEGYALATREAILDVAKQLAPEGDPRHADTSPGDLADSGRLEGENVVFDGTHGQAAFNELGTVHMAAQPFLGPAVQGVLPGFMSRMRKVILPDA